MNERLSGSAVKYTMFKEKIRMIVILKGVQWVCHQVF